MDTKTVDSVVRETLLEANLPMHFYVKYLYWALKMLDSFPKKYRYYYKQVELTVNSYKRATIPADFRSIIDLSVKNGERLESLFRDDSLNRMYNYNEGGQKIAFPEAEEVLPSGSYKVYNSDGDLVSATVLGVSGWYGLSKGDDKAFTIDYNNEEFVFTNKFKENDTLVLTYTTDPISATSANVVDHKFVDTMKTYMHWCNLKFRGAPMYEQNEAYRLYKNAKRELKAFLRPITYARLMNLTRMGTHGGLKN